MTPNNPPPAARQGIGWAFIDLATLGRNTLRSYVATVLAVVLAPIAFLALAFAVILVAAEGRLIRPATAPTLVLMVAFCSVIVAGAALIWRVVRGHRRPWLSLVSRDLRFDWRRFAIGAAVEGGLLLLFLGIARFVTGRPAPTGAGMPLPALMLLLVLVPFQAASEEMLFRGYMTQALGQALRSRAAIAVVVGLVFAAMHLGAYGPLTVPYLFGLSILFSIVSLRDERLELVIGAHAATNWFGVSAANALDIGKGNARLSGAAFLVLAVNGVLFYGLTRLLVRRFCGEGR